MGEGAICPFLPKNQEDEYAGSDISHDIVQSSILFFGGSRINTVGWKIVGNDASCADHNIIAHRHIIKDRDSCSDKDIVANRNLAQLGRLPDNIGAGIISQNCDIGGDCDVISDRNKPGPGTSIMEKAQTACSGGQSQTRLIFMIFLHAGTIC